MKPGQKVQTGQKLARDLIINEGLSIAQIRALTGGLIVGNRDSETPVRAAR